MVSPDDTAERLVSTSELDVGDEERRGVRLHEAQCLACRSRGDDGVTARCQSLLEPEAAASRMVREHNTRYTLSDGAHCMGIHSVIRAT
jgi:hypothetical protein